MFLLLKKVDLWYEAVEWLAFNLENTSFQLIIPDSYFELALVEKGFTLSNK